MLTFIYCSAFIIHWFVGMGRMATPCQYHCNRLIFIPPEVLVIWQVGVLWHAIPTFPLYIQECSPLQEHLYCRTKSHLVNMGKSCNDLVIFGTFIFGTLYNIHDSLRLDYCGFGPFCSTSTKLLLSISLLMVLICFNKKTNNKAI